MERLGREREVISTFLLMLILGLSILETRGEESYEESLWIRSLPGGQVHTRMEFLIRRPRSGVNQIQNHTHLYPRALSEILEAHQVQELHFTLTQGHWRLSSWGDPYPFSTAPTGAHVVAWFFTPSPKDTEEANANWRGLASRLSGLSCSSLNFLDETTSIEPVYGYRPEGKMIVPKDKVLSVRVGALPREFICTENLTPWTKLLPCGIMRGISSLLRSKQVFNTHYHSAGLNFVQTETEDHLKLTLSMVFDRSPFSTPNDNFAKNIIGSLAIFPCHAAKKTTVKIWENNGWKEIIPEDVNSLKLKHIPEVLDSEKELIFTPMKYMGGYGQEYGKMVIEMINHRKDVFLPVLYVEVLPWYIRPYLHTMKIEVTHGGRTQPLPAGDYFHYTPGRNRQTLHKLEMDLHIPPSSKITISFTVEKGNLKWDEYPPDANHGFYLEAAHFEVNLTRGNEVETRQYYSRILLVNLSTPDFSMPYNVICLTCTVVALAFGPIHNITTKRLQLRIVPTRKDQLKKLWAKIWRKKTDSNSDELQMENLLETTPISNSMEQEQADVEEKVQS